MGSFSSSPFPRHYMKRERAAREGAKKPVKLEGFVLTEGMDANENLSRDVAMNHRGSINDEGTKLRWKFIYF